MEAGLPFGLMGQAVLELGGSELVDEEELERLGGQPARLYRTFRWLTDVAADRPLLLALDDLHWADPDSLELLGFLCRRLVDARILVLGSLRPEPDPAWALARELVGTGHASLVSLEPLSLEASHALVDEILPSGLDRDQSDHLWKACAGTPLLLKTAATSVAAGMSPSTLSESAALGASLLLERFAGLGDEAFGYVQSASIMGVRFRPALAGTLTGLDRQATQTAHTRLLRARLLEDLGSGWAAFVHPLFAQALLESRPLSERENAHAEAFRLLVERGESDALAAQHAYAARLLGDPLAIDVIARAGRHATAQGALDAACTHLGHAVELSRDPPREELLLDFAAALAARARIEEADRVCEELLARTELDPVVRASALSLLARTAMLAGRPAEAESRCEEAVAAAAGSSLEAVTLFTGAIACNLTSPRPWTLGTVSRALAIIPDDAPVRGRLAFLRALVRLQGCDPSGEGLLASEARTWESRSDDPDPTGAWTMGVWVIGALMLLEDLEGATQVFEREFGRAVRDGAPIMMTVLAIGYADAVRRMGRPAESLELVERALALGDWAMTPWSDLALAVALTELGRDEDARPHIELVRSFCANVPREYCAPVGLWLCVLDTWQLLKSGASERASETMLDAADIARLTSFRHPCIVPWSGVAIDAHLAAGHTDRANNVLEELEQLARPLSARWPQALLALGRAQVAAALGHGDDLDHEFGEALELFAALPMPLFYAEALITYGSHLRTTGHPRNAREPLARALDLCEQAGAERTARLARAELAACGGRRRRRSSTLISLRRRSSASRRWRPRD